VLLVDTVTGSPLAMMDSITLTAIRTAATAALAAGYGARPDSRTAAIIGCGAQAGYQLDAFKARFALSDVRAFDLDRARAEGFAARVASPDMAVTAVSSIADAVAGADIVITCTTAKQPVLTADMPLAGAFVAAMGADNPEKSEIAPDLLARARLLVDDIEACASGGDLFHAIRAGTVTREHVQADLADLAAGRKPGRTRPDEIVVFDSTGSGVQDVAVAQAAYQAALVSGAGFRFDLRGRR
jgi:ornithine cyclodeaminase/alanine dehydrogenase-like protein (mu-crystallin family)